jgi:ABC-type sugar transport system ATPase subunit
MAFGLKLRKVPKDEIDKAVREAAKILDLDKLLDRKPKALSGGQRQRVAMGRAIVRNPKVFLMDEPLSNLDAKLRVQMRIEISKIHQRLGATIIYVTHDQTEAMTLGTRIVVMKDGIVQQVDSPQVLYNQPCNLFVAGFIGSPQMNFLDAKLRVQMRTEISKLHQRLGATIIYVTHDQTEAMTLGTRIVVMKDGIVQQVDTPQNLYRNPGNLFVAGFMGSPQMNFLDAQIAEKGGEVIAKVGSYELTVPAESKSSESWRLCW